MASTKKRDYFENIKSYHVRVKQNEEEKYKRIDDIDYESREEALIRCKEVDESGEYEFVTVFSDTGRCLTCMILREKYENTGLTYSQLAHLTKIKCGTLAAWLAGRRNPPYYVVRYIDMMLDEYLQTDKNNGDAIRRMNNEQIAAVLTDVRDNALYALGDINRVKPEYRDMNDYMTDIDLLKKQLMINKLLKRIRPRK